ncbi:MAG: hypothetical protein U0694_26265 [Anaerolineae bacterium]
MVRVQDVALVALGTTATHILRGIDLEDAAVTVGRALHGPSGSSKTRC